VELSPERKRSIRARIAPLLAEFDSEIELIELILDSGKQHLGVVVQKGEQPAMLRLDWLHYVSMPEAELRETLLTQLRHKGLVADDRVGDKRQS